MRTAILAFKLSFVRASMSGGGCFKFLNGTTEKWEGSSLPFFGDHRMRRPSSVRVPAWTRARSSANSHPERVMPTPDRSTWRWRCMAAEVASTVRRVLSLRSFLED